MHKTSFLVVIDRFDDPMRASMRLHGTVYPVTGIEIDANLRRTEYRCIDQEITHQEIRDARFPADIVARILGNMSKDLVRAAAFDGQTNLSCSLVSDSNLQALRRKLRRLEFHKKAASAWKGLAKRYFNAMRLAP